MTHDPDFSSIRQQFIQAANQNHSIQEFRADSRWAPIWKEDNIIARPPVRAEFEHAMVFGSLGEALSLRRSKSAWGKLLRIDPLQPDDILHPTRIVYQLKATNKIRQRWEWRDSFKHVLGKHRRLVTLAMQLKKSDFLEQLSEDDAKIIRNKLDLDAAKFWRLVRRGDKLGADGIHAFMQRLEECTKGYRLGF